MLFNYIRHCIPNCPLIFQTMLLRWEAPPSDSQNGVITGYKIRYRKQGTRKTDMTWTTDGSERAHTLTGRYITLYSSERAHTLTGRYITLYSSERAHTLTGRYITLYSSERAHTLTGRYITLYSSERAHTLTGRYITLYSSERAHTLVVVKGLVHL
jgi:hypothetical protein